VKALEDLIRRWHEDAAKFRRYGDEQLAKVCVLHADELDQTARAIENVPLTLEEAEIESGYSRSRLRHLVADGTIPNAGRKGSPRIRRGDLPRKARGSGLGFDAGQAARAVLRAD
jgi:hypothetical protein